MIAHQRVKSAASDLHLAMMKARSEAIKRNAEVRIVQGTSGSWTTGGWKVETNDPADTTSPYDVITIQNFDALKTNITVTTDPTSLTQVAFKGTGRATTTGQFVFSSSSSDKKMCVAVDLTGRPYVKEAETC